MHRIQDVTFSWLGEFRTQPGLHVNPETVFMWFFAPGPMPYHRPSSELEMIKMEHQKEISELKKFLSEISEALDKCKVLTEKTNSYQ